MWHAAGEDELVFPAMEKVAPLVAQGYLHDHHEFDTMTEGLAKINAASDALVAAREAAALTAVLRIHLDKEDEQLYPILKDTYFLGRAIRDNRRHGRTRAARTQS